LGTGVDPDFRDPENADGATDYPYIPRDQPVDTRIEGPWGLPWWESLEQPDALSGQVKSPDLQFPEQDVGASPIGGAYEGAYATIGPITAFGEESQMLGRIMRFPANIPERGDPNGVFDTDWRDQLGSAIDANNAPYITDAEVTTMLVNYPDAGYYGF
jgi:hypothetical protein